VAWAWLFANDPAIAEGKIFIFIRFWLFLFEAAWILYGSTFVFSDEFANCESAAIEAGIDKKVAD